MFLKKRILYLDQPATVACDGRCEKAWGYNCRPQVNCSDERDDTAYLSDLELDYAPVDPGTYECDQAKPRSIFEFPNKWCVRECERCWISPVGNPDAEPQLHNFDHRVYNLFRRRNVETEEVYFNGGDEVDKAVDLMIIRANKRCGPVITVWNGIELLVHPGERDNQRLLAFYFENIKNS